MDEKKLINLVNRAMQRDNAAMEELYTAYYKEVMFVCKKYNLNDEDAKDIAQETFIKAFKEISTLKNASLFSKWLIRIASNKCLDLLRHNKTLAMDTLSSDEMELDIPDKSKSSEELVLDEEVREIISQMISKLPIEQRVTIFMYYYQDYSIKEIAEAYGCSESTVKSRLGYAKKAMRQEAERLENKGVKLRTIAVLPFLYMFFAEERKVFACEVADCVGVISEVIGTGVTTGVVKAGFLTTMAGKITIGVAALAIVAGGVITGIAVTGGFDTNKPIESTKEADRDLTDDVTETIEDEISTSTEGIHIGGNELIDYYDYEVNYLNEAGIANGKYTFILRKLGAEDFTDCIIGVYENEDKTASYLMSQKNSNGDEYCRDYIYDLSYGVYAKSDAVNEAGIYETIDTYVNNVSIERKSALYYETAEEYAEKKDDVTSEDESYYINDYYVVINYGNGVNYYAAYKYFDAKNIVCFRRYFEEYSQEDKEIFDNMLQKITLDYVGDISNISGTGNALSYDYFAKLLLEKYPIYLKDYTAIRDFDPTRFTYKTENCEYTVICDSSVGFMEDVERGLYELELDYGDGTAIYSSTTSAIVYVLLNENIGCKAHVKMETDVDEPDEMLELLREELLK